MIKCFTVSSDNKLRRLEEEALSRAVRTGKLKASVLIDKPEDNYLVPKRLLEPKKKHSKKQQQKQQQGSLSRPVSHFPSSEDNGETKDLQFLVPAEGENQNRLKTEKFLSVHGDVMLKKQILHTRRARSCATCKFREWSKGDVCYLLVKNNKNNTNRSSRNDNKQAADDEVQQLYLWLCPDCALQNGMPEEHYHYNRNRMPPVPDPVIDITMNREISAIDPEDVAWVTKAQQRPKPMNWKSQYAQYYNDVVMEKERQEYVCAPISQDPENPESYIAAATACSQRSKEGSLKATACYVPDTENDAIQEACFMYLGDL